MSRRNFLSPTRVALVAALTLATLGCSLMPLTPDPPPARTAKWQRGAAPAETAEAGPALVAAVPREKARPIVNAGEPEWSADGSTRLYTLGNGMRVVLREQRASPVVALQVWVRVGGADEIGPEAGIAHVHEHMLFKGTKRRGVGEIASAVESAGGRINAWTSWDQTVYHIVMASRFADEGLDILADAVRNSSFDPDELAKELGVVLEEYKRGRDSAGQRLYHTLFGQAFNVHPYQRAVIGTEESIKGLTREMILDFYARYYAPNNMTLVIVGDFDSDHMMAEIDRQFADFEPRELDTPIRPTEPPQDTTRFALETMDIKEGNLALGFHIPDGNHPDAVKLDVLAHILGEGESSRLNRRLVIDEELATSAGAFAYTPPDPGLFIVTATFDPPNEEEVVQAALEEVARVRDFPVSDAEMERARANLESDFVYRRQTVQGQARELGYFVIVHEDPDYDHTYMDALHAVTAADVQEVALRYLRPENLTGVAVLPDGATSQLTTEELASRAAVLASASPQRTAKRETSLRRAPTPVTASEQTGAPRLFRLANGLRLIVEENHTVPLFSVRAAMLGGLLAETPANNGIANFATEMLTRGTARRSREDLAETIEALAGDVRGFSGRNSIGVSATFLSEHAREGLDLFLEVLLEPAFSPDEVEKARRELLLAIDHREDESASRTFDLAWATLYPRHPYGMTTLGERTTVAALSPEDLRSFYRDALDPRSLVVTVVGDVDTEAVADRFKQALGALAPDDTPFRMPPAAGLPTAPRRAARHSDRRQSHIVLAYPGVSVDSPDRHALSVMDTILSAQGGRLFYELRDKQALAYSVTGFSAEGLARGMVGAYIATDPTNETRAAEGLALELERIRKEPVSVDELERARRYLIGNYEIALQTNAAIAENMMFNELYGLGYLEGRRFAEQIRSVAAEDVQRVAERYLDATMRVEAVIGPNGAAGVDVPPSGEDDGALPPPPTPGS
jgi:zinc protease